MGEADPTANLRARIERAKAEHPDPAERDQVLAALEEDLNDLLGRVRTYRSDARLQLEGGGGEASSG
jgi:hypothetical protein